MTATAVPSSSSFAYNWIYDVFLSFRGEDTRIGFTGNLYNALHQRGIHTFIDDEELRRGEEITPALHKAIEQSRIAIIVFSKNYASSTFCLSELVKILECIKGKGRLVWPVFYDVDPSEVRHQKGSYGESLTKHEKKFQYNEEIVQTWRLGLCEAANLSGWHFKHGHEYEYTFIGRIVKEVSSKLDRTPLHIAKYPVGLETRVLEVKSLIDAGFDDRVSMVGILGIGGIGKSALARAVYNLIADQFDGLCFLPNVRESSTKHGLEQLQETLLYELVQEKNIKLRDINQGIPILKRRLQEKKVLVILDDVDKIEQLEALAGALDWFGNGSTIIITTRDNHLLDIHGVKRKYEVQVLDHKEALELFCWNAFKSNEVDPSYMEISEGVVHYAQGLPLVLEVIGSNLFGKSIDECKSALDIYTRIPIGKVQDVLKVSYDGLEKIEQEIFLDIACFFKGLEYEYVQDMIQHARDFNPQYGIGVLVDKSLVRINAASEVEMHDLVQDMGREIIRLQSTEEPGKRSRLWCYEDIIHVLEENTGTDRIEAITLDLAESKKEEKNWNDKAFKKMKNLKILIIRNVCFSKGPRILPNSLRVLEWWEYPASCLPADFHPKKLAVLKLPYSCLVSFEASKRMENLTVLNFNYCKFITKIPDVSNVPNLIKLSLEKCTNLVEIHDTVGFLKKLRILDASHCGKLRAFPHAIWLPSLERLFLSYCLNLTSFPQILKKMEKLKGLHLGGTGIEKLPFSICNLTRLQTLVLTSVKKIQTDAQWNRGLQLSEEDKSNEENAISTVMSSVEDVTLTYSDISDEFLALCLTWFANVKELYLGSSNVTVLPTCIRDCQFLRHIDLRDCKQLREIRGIPPNLQMFLAENCTSLCFQSRRMLLNEVFHKGKNFFVCVPGTRITGWFDYSSIEDCSSVSSGFGSKSPALALAYVIGPTTEYGLVRNAYMDVTLFINDKKHGTLVTINFNDIASDHIVVFDLECIKSLIIEQYMHFEKEWTHMEISFEFSCHSKQPPMATCVDVAVFDSEIAHWQHQQQLVSLAPPTEQVKESLLLPRPWISGCSVDEELQQQHSSSSNKQNFEGTETVNKAKGKEIIACNSYDEREKDKSLLVELPSTSKEYEVTSEKEQPTSHDKSLTWDPTKFSDEKEQLVSNDQSIINDQGNDEMEFNQRRNQWQFRLCSLISSIVSLCSSSSSSSSLAVP